MIIKKELMAKAEKLNILAAKNQLFPDNLTQPEQVYYLTLRRIYADYRAGTIGKSQGAEEKKKAIAAFVEAAYIYDKAKQHGAIHDVFVHEFHKDDIACKRCRLYDTVCGLINSEEKQ